MYANGQGANQDHLQAVHWYRKAAEQGHVEAQFTLGWMHYKGEGISKDKQKAAHWLGKAAEQGHVEAQYNLGWMYYQGEGVKENYLQAVQWLEKAAEQGHVEAQFNLGWMYYKGGEGVAQDDLQAAYWSEKAAEQGHAEAQYNLGWMYKSEKGEPHDGQQAEYWLRKAAERGPSWMQYDLGVMYGHGMRVGKDHLQAAYWYRKAAEQGHIEAHNRLVNMYSKGIGVKQDHQQATYWYRKAAEQGWKEVQNNLGRMHADIRVEIEMCGGTSYILLIALEGEEARLLQQGSAPLSVYQLLEVTSKSSAVREAIHYFITSNASPVKIIGVGNMIPARDIAPYYLNIILDRLRDEDFDKFYKALALSKSLRVNKTEARAVFAIPTYICGVLLFYAGQLAAKAIRDHNLTDATTFELFPFGQGRRMFDWLVTFIGKADALDYYHRCFKAGYGENSENIRLVKADLIGQDAKFEVSFDGSTEREAVVYKPPRNASDLFGEKGFVYKGNTIAASDPVTSEHLDRIEHFDSIPSNFVNFENFLNLFLDLAGPNDARIIENTQPFLENLPQLRRRLKNYITYDREYIHARNSGGSFDYKHSLLILISMCYLDEVLIPELFKS